MTFCVIFTSAAAVLPDVDPMAVDDESDEILDENAEAQRDELDSSSEEAET